MKYVIIESSDASSVNFSEVLETSSNTLRYSTNNAKAFVKFTGDTPSFVDGKTQYTHSEILAILNNVDGEWYTEITI